jgi:hypothetical protein
LPFGKDKGKPSGKANCPGAARVFKQDQAMTSEAQEKDETPASAVPQAAEAIAPKKSAGKKRHRTGLGLRLLFLVLVFGAIFGVLGLSGRPIPMPVFVVAEIEARANAALAKALPDASLALGGVELRVDSDWVPRLRLDDVRLLKPGGAALLTLPEVRVSVEPSALLHGQLRLRRLKITGAHLQVSRDVNGAFDFDFGATESAAPIRSFSDLFDAVDSAFAQPGAENLISVEAEALTISYKDARSGRMWELGDGRLRLDNRETTVAAELGLSVISGSAPAQAVLTVVSEKSANLARITAQIDNVAARDLAAEIAPFSWAGAVDAPMSGRIQTTLAADGLEAFEASLTFGSGALQPSPEARAIAFDHAEMRLLYDPAQGRMAISELSVQSPTLRLQAAGQTYMVRTDGSHLIGPLGQDVPDAYLAQLTFSQVMIDPEKLFQEPVKFSDGVLDLRLRVNPFSVEIGQMVLREDQRRLSASGKVSADAKGWKVAVDLSLNEIAHDRLVALWPVALVPNTRQWVDKNVLSGSLTDVQASLRMEQDSDPRLHLGYNFANADVRFVNTLPPIEAGSGYANINGSAYTMVLSQGTVTPPEGGQIDVAGSVFAIHDVTTKPAIADITLHSQSSLTAALSLLDQPPFHFMSKADQPVTLGEGHAAITTTLRLPLQKKILIPDVDYKVSGVLSDVVSTSLVPGRKIAAPRLIVSASPAGLQIAGKGQIGAVPFNVTYSQAFTPEEKGHARIIGTVTLSQVTTEEFGLGLPGGMVSGAGQGRVEINLRRGQPGKLSLKSDLSGIGLIIPEVGWRKAAGTKGKLDAEVTLGKPPKVDSLQLQAAGLDARGAVSLNASGGLDVARFERVKLMDWLDAPVEIQGRGRGHSVALAVKGGTVDMRRIPAASQRSSSGAKAGDTPLDLRLDELRVSSSISLTNFQGNFGLSGGISGNFTAGLNGKVAVRGTAIAARHGTAVRLQSDNAGAVLAAAGVFQSARNGSLDLTLTPRAQEGFYDGHIAMANLRVRNTNVLADLLNAISVVGILEQLNGEGLVFNEAQGDFVLAPNGIEVSRASAVGASLGVSMAGVYRTSSDELFMQGVISPVYLLNGIGALFSKRGEGLFGFNYSLRGKASDPAVGVNPLSILTPGMFREIFRAAPPKMATKP